MSRHKVIKCSTECSAKGSVASLAAAHLERRAGEILESTTALICCFFREETSYLSLE
jgi:hypothetical protein